MLGHTADKISNVREAIDQCEYPRVSTSYTELVYCGTWFVCACACACSFGSALSCRVGGGRGVVHVYMYMYMYVYMYICGEIGSFGMTSLGMRMAGIY